MFIELNQVDKRYYKSDPEYGSYKYARTRLIIGRLDSYDKVDRYEVSGSACIRNTTIEHVFEPGDYVMTIQIL